MSTATQNAFVHDYCFSKIGWHLPDGWYDLAVRKKPKPKKIKRKVTTMDEQEYNRCISLIEQNKN